jgi:tRNA(fMet)-specific endonuclease VapC
MYILDTDSLSLYERGHPQITVRVEACPPGDLAVSIISVEEQLTGWYGLLRRARTTEQLAAVYQRLTETVGFLSRLRILTFTEPAIRRYDELGTRKLNIGKMDLRIAAIVLEYGGTVVTRNTRDFGRVPGLPVEDWTQ